MIWITLLGSGLLAVIGKPWWWSALLAVGLATAHIVRASIWWEQIGIQNYGPHVTMIFGVHGVGLVIGLGAGYGLRWLALRAKTDPAS